MSDMADVLRRELAKGSYQMPGDTLPYETQAANVAAALSAAGFGPVREAQEAAFEDGVFACVTAVAQNKAPVNPYRSKDA
jgi:hypothetical protein